MSVFPVKIGLPKMISAKMQPADQISTAVPYFVSPRRSSGGRYQRVMTLFVKSPSFELKLSEFHQYLRFHIGGGNAEKRY
jgi:hypothetical protein